MNEAFEHKTILLVTPATAGDPTPAAQIALELRQHDLRVATIASFDELHALLPAASVAAILYHVGAGAAMTAPTPPNGPPQQPPETALPETLHEFIQTLLRAYRSVSAPVIAVGESNSPSLRRQALAAGAMEYISYPLDWTELMETLELAVERHRAMVAEVQRQVQERYHALIGIIQHEFRTPMTLLLGYGEYLREALEDEVDRDELRLSVEAILSGSERLNRLIESFLLLSELQYREAHEVRLQQVAPGVLWREVQAILRTETESAKQTIVYVQPEIVPQVEIDPELIREALTRLLDNALRYARPESREIRLGVSFDETSIQWSIEDEGVGMSAEQIRLIREPFTGARAQQYAPQSMGLSLAIVRRVAELHGGELLLESKLDEGSRFVLRVPQIFSPGD